MSGSDVAGSIHPKLKPPPPPDGLSEGSAKLWRTTVSEFVFGSTELALLESALRALDRAEEARSIVEEAGPVWVTERTGAIHAHPCVRIEAEARREFRLCWRQLGLVDADGLEAVKK